MTTNVSEMSAYLSEGAICVQLNTPFSEEKIGNQWAFSNFIC